MNLKKIFVFSFAAAVLLSFGRCACAAGNSAGSGYDVYVFGRPYTGRLWARNGKDYVDAESMAKAMDLPVKEEPGAVRIGAVSGGPNLKGVIVNGKTAADAFQDQNGKWLVELASFASQTGNQYSVNDETKIIDILPGGTQILSPKAAEALFLKKSAQGAPAALAAGDFLTYHNAQYGITLKYPPDWEKLERIGGSLVAFRRPMQKASKSFLDNLNLVVAPVPAGETLSLDQLLQDGAAFLKKDFPSLETLDTGSAVLSGNPAATQLYRYKLSGIPLKLLQVVTLNNKKAYVFSYTASEENYEKFLPAVQAILDSFEVK